MQRFIPTVRGVGSICDCAFAGAVATGLRKVARITAAKSDRPFGVKWTPSRTLSELFSHRLFLSERKGVKTSIIVRFLLDAI